MLKKMNENKIFEELYIAIIFIIALIGWFFKTQYGYMSIATSTLIVVLLFNDIKYAIPCGFGLIFSIGTGFTTDQKYGPLIGSAIVYFSVFIIYMIRNGIKLKNIKSYKGLLLLGILNLIPLIYHNTIKQGIESGALNQSATSLYILYFGYLCYVVGYFFFVIILDKNSLRMTFKTLGYMSLILSFECIIYVLTNGFIKAYRLGWGHVNEAGILILLGLPFLTIGLIKAESKKELILPVIKLLVAIVGIVCSTSRGTYLFGIIEIFVLLVYTFIVSKYRKILIASAIGILALALLGIQIKFGIVPFFNDLIDSVFVRGFYMGDRFRLWKEAFYVWNTDWLTRIFGAGMVGELTKPGFEDMNTFIVYHSTFFSALAVTGILGVIALGIHFYERYRQVKFFDKNTMIFILIGFVLVDIYGLMDNTYGMYYFMVPIVIFMAAVDSYVAEMGEKIEIDLRWNDEAN